MSSPAENSASHVRPLWRVPRLQPGQRWLGGAASAIAREVGVEPLVVRLAFVVLALASGLGFALYAACWLLFARATAQSVALEPVPKGRSTAHRQLGVWAFAIGLTLLSRELVPLGFDDTFLWPVALAAFGLLLAWSSGKVDWSEPRELARAAGGLLAVAAGVISFIALNFGTAVAPRALLVATGVLALVVAIVAPWLWRAASQVSEQRLERARAVERAELAAHLHDSVLQTLSLITRNADDPSQTRRLARRQERELRKWLFEAAPAAAQAERFRAALTRVAAEVEEQHGVPIEVVVVGEGAVDDAVQAVLAAAREALVNAARHSGAERVDLYGELRDGHLEVFVRDKGRGFAQSRVPSDRRGVSESIVGRMERAGGEARVSSAVGRGTEVALEIRLGASSSGPPAVSQPSLAPHLSSSPP